MLSQTMKTIFYNIAVAALTAFCYNIHHETGSSGAASNKDIHHV